MVWHCGMPAVKMKAVISSPALPPAEEAESDRLLVHCSLHGCSVGKTWKKFSPLFSSLFYGKIIYKLTGYFSLDFSIELCFSILEKYIFSDLFDRLQA